MLVNPSDRLVIFPARVGMNRLLLGWFLTTLHFPRASGDEPLMRTKHGAEFAFSPREWG